MKEMETHLQVLRQASEMAEKAEMGKVLSPLNTHKQWFQLQMDWNALAEDDEAEAAEEGEQTETKIETVPLVDKPGTSSSSDNKEEK